MPKILVADDNSNVQRTVTLALSDYGVEVVAVNNGEAAVRKLADFTPDLILADIFMPVRNGYEVCEYVKHIPQFANTPVVLLVGAFDPFDEREAQRVGADGILKKPFVPPDPLIAMVRTLLDRAMAARPVPVPAAVSASPAAITQRTVASSVRKVYPPVEEIPETAPEPDFGAHPRVAFGEGDTPVAFENLFETPAVSVEPQVADPSAAKDDGILTSKRDAALGDPGFWRKGEGDAEPAFEGALAAESGAPVLDRPWESAVGPTADHPIDDSFLSDPAALSTASFELIPEAPDENASPTADASSILQDPAALSKLSVDVEKPAELAANPLDWMASATAPTSAVIEPVKVVEEEASIIVESSRAVPVETPAEAATEVPVATGDTPTADISAIEIPSATIASLVTPVIVPVTDNSIGPLSAETAEEFNPPAEPAAQVEDVPAPAEKLSEVHLEAVAPKQYESNEIDSNQVDSSQVDSNRVDSSQQDSNQNDSSQHDPTQHDSRYQVPVHGATTHEASGQGPSSHEVAPPIRVDLHTPVASDKWADLAEIVTEMPKPVFELPKHNFDEAPEVHRVPVAEAPISATFDAAAVTAETPNPTRDAPRPHFTHETWAGVAGVTAEEVPPVAKLPDAPYAKLPDFKAAEPVHVLSSKVGPTAPVAETHVIAAGDAPASQAVSPIPAASVPDPAVVEAVVQRVLEKMSPQVIDIITREFLRPVVQALVKREVEKR